MDRNRFDIGFDVKGPYTEPHASLVLSGYKETKYKERGVVVYEYRKPTTKPDRLFR